MKNTSAGAARLWRVAHLFTRMVETLVEEYVHDPETKSLGKRKRKPREQLNTEGLPAHDLTENMDDMQFLRPVQPQIHQDGNRPSSSDITTSNTTIAQIDEHSSIEHETGIPLQTPFTEPTYIHDQMLNITDQGSLDFDWILWDQCLEPNLEFGFDPTREAM